MEVPTELKQLYRHWEVHSQFAPQALKAKNITQFELLQDIEEFVTERMNIWHKKYSDKNKPYTANAILQKYRFCNIYRELDRQTIEIHSDLVDVRDNFTLWLLNICFYRFVCKPATNRAVGRLELDEKHNKRVYQHLMDLPSPKYGSAYIFPISTIQKSAYNTRELFFTQYLPRVIPDIATKIETFQQVTVDEALTMILPLFGFNLRFHWTEILIDIAYQFPEKIDLFRNFHIGPGAQPTIERLSSDETVLDSLVHYVIPAFPYLTFNGEPVYLSAENWEGIACEFRKYSNLKAGKGRRRLF